MSDMSRPDLHICEVFVKENNRLVCKKCGKVERIVPTWADLVLPPINLWSLPN
jgi:hypothetical protein